MSTPWKLNVGLVDDDPTIVRLVSTFIEAEFSDKINLVAMTDSVVARDWLDVNCCDILISDISMPDLDGLEILRFAKTRNAWTQVIFITGHSTWERVSEALDAGASDYLVKPIVRDDLIHVIGREIDRLTRWKRVALKTLQKT